MNHNLTSLLRGTGERRGWQDRHGSGGKPVFNGRFSNNNSSLLWLITDSSVTDHVNITVGPGVLYRSIMARPDSSGHLPTAIPCQRYDIASTEKVDIVDGDILYVKIDWPIDPYDASEPPEPVDASDYSEYLKLYNPIADAVITTFDTEIADGHVHEVIVEEAGASNIAAEMRHVGLEFQAATYEIYNAEQTDDREHTYIKIGTFAVVDDVLTISQIVLGAPIPIYPLTYYYGQAIGD